VEKIGWERGPGPNKGLSGGGRAPYTIPQSIPQRRLDEQGAATIPTEFSGHRRGGRLNTTPTYKPVRPGRGDTGKWWRLYGDCGTGKSTGGWGPLSDGTPAGANFLTGYFVFFGSATGSVHGENLGQKNVSPPNQTNSS